MVVTGPLFYRFLMLTARSTFLVIPDTVQAVLAARLDQVPLEEKRLLQAAAVIGMDVPLPLLQALS